MNKLKIILLITFLIFFTCENIVNKEYILLKPDTSGDTTTIQEDIMSLTINPINLSNTLFLYVQGLSQGSSYIYEVTQDNINKLNITGNQDNNTITINPSKFFSISGEIFFSFFMQEDSGQLDENENPIYINVENFYIQKNGVITELQELPVDSVMPGRVEGINESFELKNYESDYTDIINLKYDRFVRLGKVNDYLMGIFGDNYGIFFNMTTPVGSREPGLYFWPADPGPEKVTSSVVRIRESGRMVKI